MSTGGPTVYAVGRASVRNDIGSVLVGTNTWDHEALREFVIARAKNLQVADSTAALARHAGLTHSQLSKWFRGQERPRPDSLKKLAAAIALPHERAEGKTPYPELLVLTGHLGQEQSGLTEAPTPPPLVERDPQVAELERLLAPSSRLSEDEKEMLRGFVERAMEGFKPRRSGRRRTA